MRKCPICKKELDWLSHHCRFCDKAFCLEHRLPENHNCTGLRFYKKFNQPSEGIVYETKTMNTRPPEISKVKIPWQMHRSPFYKWRKRLRRWVRENPAISALLILFFIALCVVIWGIFV